MNMKKSFKDLLGRIEHVLEQEGLEDIVLDCVENYDEDGFIVFLSCIYEGVPYESSSCVVFKDSVDVYYITDFPNEESPIIKKIVKDDLIVEFVD